MILLVGATPPVQELRLALRRLRRRPVRGAVTALTLAIGIGATVAAFAAVDGVLLRDLPVERQDELVVVWHLNPERGSLEIPFAPASYDAVVRGTGSLAEAAGFTGWGAVPMLVEAAGDSYALNWVRVAGDFFGVLGADAAVGRLLTAADDDVGAVPAVVLSYSAWRNRYGADPALVGSTLLIGGVSYTVVGISQEGFDFPRGVDVWVPLRIDYADESTLHELHVLGRMASGADRAAVAADVTESLTVGRGEGWQFWADLSPIVRGFEERVVGSVRPILRAGLAAALLLFLAAAANAALFLLSGGRAAANDLAVRRALGAERPQLVGRLLADSGLVCALGVTGGLTLAWLALRFLIPLVPPELGPLDSVDLDWRAGAFAASVGLAAALLTGSVAGVVLSRPDIRTFLAAGGRGHTGGGATFQRAVAGVQVALTVVSAVGAGLLARTVVALDRLDPGLATADMTVVTLSAPYGFFDVPETYFAALEDVVRGLEARPGIIAVRPTLGPPLQQRLEVVLIAEGQDEDTFQENPYVAVDAILPGHFRALGIPLLAGRALTELDNRPEADPVVVVDEVLAGALWPGEDPLGKRINGFGYEETWFTVVGVAAGTRYRELLEAHPRAYYPLRRLGNSPPSALLVRASPAASASIGNLVREAFARADPRVRVMDTQRLSTVLRGPTAARRFAASVFTSFAVATLLLAALGVYGVFTVSVQERTREMGVRRALGAQQARIVRLVLAGILKVAAAGAAGGILVSIWASRLVESLLFGVAPIDPRTFVAVVAGSVVMALAAGLAPAWRASSVDPAVSLRAE